MYFLDNIIRIKYDLKTNWELKGELFSNYGWYHLMWLGIMIVATIVLTLVFARKHNKKVDDRVIFSIGALLLEIEIYKQVFYTIDAGHYQWYAFPFQFCSVPMYVAFIAPLIKNEKVKEAMYKFLAFFGLLAGLAVMLYPDTCLNTRYISILIHTMLWHSSMVVMGVYLVVARKYGQNIFKEVLPGSIVFVIILAIAIIANIIAYKTYFGIPEKNIYNDTFFLMYVSPYYDSPLPILSNIKASVPYPIFMLSYIMAFVVGIAFLWLIVYGIRQLCLALSKKKEHIKEKNKNLIQEEVNG